MKFWTDVIFVLLHIVGFADVISITNINSSIWPPVAIARPAFLSVHSWIRSGKSVWIVLGIWSEGYFSNRGPFFEWTSKSNCEKDPIVGTSGPIPRYGRVFFPSSLDTYIFHIVVAVLLLSYCGINPQAWFFILWDFGRSSTILWDLPALSHRSHDMEENFSHHH